MKHRLWALWLACTTSAWAVPDWTQADIVKIEPERARVTLYHQPIKSIDMEAMTMSFRVGHKVRFTVTEANGHLVVDQMGPAK